jgi:hypothetical protein
MMETRAAGAGGRAFGGKAKKKTGGAPFGAFSVFRLLINQWISFSGQRAGAFSPKSPLNGPAFALKIPEPKYKWKNLMPGEAENRPRRALLELSNVTAQIPDLSTEFFFRKWRPKIDIRKE